MRIYRSPRFAVVCAALLAALPLHAMGDDGSSSARDSADSMLAEILGPDGKAISKTDVPAAKAASGRALAKSRDEAIDALLSDAPSPAVETKTSSGLRISPPISTNSGRMVGLVSSESPIVTRTGLETPRGQAIPRQPVANSSNYGNSLPKMRSVVRPGAGDLRVARQVAPGEAGNPFVDDDQAGNAAAPPVPARSFDPPAGANDWVSVSGGCDSGRSGSNGSSCSLGSGCDAACGSGCGDNCDLCISCGPRFRVFADYLYLRASNTDVDYAIEIDGPPAAANQGIQMGRTATVEQEYSSGYRVGFAYGLSECGSIGASYTNFDSGADDDITRRGTNDIRSSVTHPQVFNAAADWISAEASLDVEFQLADLEYRWAFCSGCNHQLNLFVGGRYGNLEQNFRSRFSQNGDRTVDTDIQFDGGGLRVGFDFQRQIAACSGLGLYGNAAASFLAGQWQADYLQSADFDPIEVETSWHKNRVVPILDLEAGLSWHNACGNVGLSVGYSFSAWLDTLTTDEFIRAVHRNNFDDLGETVTFDGMVVRGEYRF